MLTGYHRPFAISAISRDTRQHILMRVATPVIERALAFPALNDIYAAIKDAPDDGRDFTDKALEVLGVRACASQADLSRIPRTGPVVVVANHPFGGIEGLILYSLLRRVRPDVKLLANYLLATVLELRDSFIFVDPFGGAEAPRKNRASMREAVHWVTGGGVLGIFPAGEVSHLHLRTRTVTDPPWSQSVSRLIRRTGASVVPVFIEGRNSALFQTSGLIHPKLRTTMLPRELLRMRNQSVLLRIGSAVAPKRVRSFSDNAALTNYLRVRTYILKSDDAVSGNMIDTEARTVDHGACPIVNPLPPETMLDEVTQLPRAQCLLSHGDMDVMIGDARQVPTVLREIGRLREVAFRLVGEGTGKSIDLDRFDTYYKHLFVWDRNRARVVGAYRMGLTDDILPRYGVEGLYTSSLFRFRLTLLDQIDPAIELGRSFVHPEEQRGFAPLMLLWCGIGRFIASNPRYRRMFGTVSISSRYNSMSKAILMHFLQTHRALPKLAALLKPRNPPRRQRPSGLDLAAFSTVVENVGCMDELITDLEADGKPMPVLLRQYLKLNGRLLGLNIDPEFGNVLDGLMLLDVMDIPRPLLNKYMGPDGVRGFMAFHKLTS